jgi:dipeptidyl-peptidase 4
MYPSNLFRVLAGTVLLLTIGSFSTAYAQKVLTMREALQRRAALAPANLRQLQWIPGTETFGHVVNNQWAITRATAPQQSDTLDVLAPINRALEQRGKQPLTGMPPVVWLDKHTLWFHTNDEVYEWSAPGGLVLKNSHPDAAENIDYQDKTYRAAYTIGDVLHITVDSKETTIATGGNGIVYGKSVHRDEFGIYKGTFWSNSGRALAFYRMDESMVTEYPVYVLDSMPAQAKMIRYPYAGAKSHHVTIGVFDIQTGTTVYLKTGEPAEQYLTNVSWTPDDKHIIVAVVNREQNHMWLKMYDASTGNEVATLLEETATTWVEPEKPVVFVPKNDEQFVIQSERDGYNHLYLYEIETQRNKPTTVELICQLTKGNTPVTNFYGFSDDGKRCFYQMADASGLNRFLGSTTLRGCKQETISPLDGTHSGLISKSGDWLLDVFSDATTPRTIFVQQTRSASTRSVHFNAKNPLEGITMGQTRIEKIQSAGGFDLNVRAIMPPNMEAGRRYPVILYVYNGPHVQMVTNSWLNNGDIWMHRLANQGYVVLSVDGRGSAYRGHAFESALHRRLGDVEMQDQLAAIRFAKSQGWADSTRIGVYGWSYGGFMATSLMTRPEAIGVFKCGIAGGPVLDWRMYEIMYTERYMDSPRENPDGYAKNSLFNYIGNLNAPLLMIHGSSDPVVTMQHSMRYVRECVRKGKAIDYFIYPEHEHNVIGPDRAHLFEKIEAYFKANL